MRIFMVGSEAVPYAKTGGLADVLGALPRALGRLGHSVDVVMPRYRGCPESTRVATFPIVFDGKKRALDIFADTNAPGVRTLFVDAPEYFDREQLYGDASADYPDNAARFGLLARAAVALALGTGAVGDALTGALTGAVNGAAGTAAGGVAYDVAHAHDWQAGLVPAFAMGSSGVSRPLPTVFTIHNLAYQGIFDPGWLPRIGLGPDMMRMDAMEYWGKFSFLKGGITFSRIITTVSPRYAEEIQTTEFGFGFDGLLRRRSGDLMGILNGIDYDHWDPERDVHLPAAFNASNLTGKLAAKRRVLETFRMAVSPEALRRPLIGMISRLVDQKGFDLLGTLRPVLPAMDATFVLLGTGDSAHEQTWRSLAADYPDRIGASIGFDEPLAHLIEGGADMFLMPSRFEPCGLNQMYSLRYGTVPIVRDVGGLHNTVRNYDERTGEGTGFVFGPATPQALEAALRRALRIYARRDIWARIQQAGMREDHSWDASARQYVAAYERAIRYSDQISIK